MFAIKLATLSTSLVKGFDTENQLLIHAFFDFCMDSKKINPLLARPDCKESLSAIMHFCHQLAIYCQSEADQNKYALRARSIIAILHRKPLSSIPLQPLTPLPSPEKHQAEISTELKKYSMLLGQLEWALQLKTPSPVNTNAASSVQEKDAITSSPLSVSEEPVTAAKSSSVPDSGSIQKRQDLAVLKILEQEKDAAYASIIPNEDLHTIMDAIVKDMVHYFFTQKRTPSQPDPVMIRIFQALVYKAFSTKDLVSLNTSKSVYLQKAFFRSASECATHIATHRPLDIFVIESLNNLMIIGEKLRLLKNLDPVLFEKTGDTFFSVADVTGVRKELAIQWRNNTRHKKTDIASSSIPISSSSESSSPAFFEPADSNPDITKDYYLAPPAIIKPYLSLLNQLPGSSPCLAGESVLDLLEHKPLHSNGRLIEIVNLVPETATHHLLKCFTQNRNNKELYEYFDFNIHIKCYTSKKSLDRDLSSREFTITGLYYCYQSRKIINPTGLGLSDLKHKVLRTINQPDFCFANKPESILNAIKFIVHGYSPCNLDEAILNWYPDANFNLPRFIKVLRRHLNNSEHKLAYIEQLLKYGLIHKIFGIRSDSLLHCSSILEDLLNPKTKIEKIAPDIVCSRASFFKGTSQITQVNPRCLDASTSDEQSSLIKALDLVVRF